ncbi:hypothetical protein HaLaN_08952, partial [Haematococcus lacustris]
MQKDKAPPALQSAVAQMVDQQGAAAVQVMLLALATA